MLLLIVAFYSQYIYTLYIYIDIYLLFSLTCMYMLIKFLLLSFVHVLSCMSISTGAKKAQHTADKTQAN